MIIITDLNIMKKEITTTKDLREQLKSIMEEQVSKFPELLEELEPLDKVNAICKLMPYVYPKVHNVSSSSGEGMGFLGFD